MRVQYLKKSPSEWAEKKTRRIARDEKYKRDDKRTETRGLTELERRGERKEYKEDRFSWQLTGSKKRKWERSKPDGGRKRREEWVREREKERGDRFACSAACPACPCAVGGMLHVELTARIYILLARIFISVRGRLTSSMTGGRDAWCLAWLCLTAFLRTSLRRATARGDAKAKGTTRLTMLSHHSGTARRFDPTRRHEFPSASPTCLSLLAPRHVSGGSASRSLLHFPLSCDRDAENCDRD